MAFFKEHMKTCSANMRLAGVRICHLHLIFVLGLF